MVGLRHLLLLKPQPLHYRGEEQKKSGDLKDPWPLRALRSSDPISKAVPISSKHT